MSQVYAFNGRGYTNTIIRVQNQLCDEIAQRNQSWTIRTPIHRFTSPREATSLVNVLLRYHITSRLAYAEATDFNLGIAELFFKDLKPEHHKLALAIVRNFLNHPEIDEMDIDLMLQVERVLKPGTWNDVKIIEEGSSFVIAINEDIRIIEYNKQEGLDYHETTDRVLDL